MTSSKLGAIADPKSLRGQYRNSNKLQARAKSYTSNTARRTLVAFRRESRRIVADAAVLDIGCGPGWMWKAARATFRPG